jgi:hypothetical protein
VRARAGALPGRRRHVAVGGLVEFVLTVFPVGARVAFRRSGRSRRERTRVAGVVTRDLAARGLALCVGSWARGSAVPAIDDGATTRRCQQDAEHDRDRSDGHAPEQGGEEVDEQAHAGFRLVTEERASSRKQPYRLAALTGSRVQLVQNGYKVSEYPWAEQGVCNKCATVWTAHVEELCARRSQVLPISIHSEKFRIASESYALTSIHPQSTGVKKKITVKFKT